MLYLRGKSNKHLLKQTEHTANTFVGSGKVLLRKSHPLPYEPKTTEVRSVTVRAVRYVCLRQVSPCVGFLAGACLAALLKPLTHTQQGLEARVGIGLFSPRLRLKYTRFPSVIKDNSVYRPIPFFTLLVSVLVSAQRELKRVKGTTVNMKND